MITRFTVLPFLVSFLIAVAGMPTNVIAVNRFEMGHEHTQPWRSTSLDAVSRGISRSCTYLRQALRDLWGHPLRGPALAGAAVLAVAMVAPDLTNGAALAVIGTVGLKEARQEVADLDRRIAANAARNGEIDKEILAITDTVTTEKRGFKPEEETKLADLRQQKKASNDVRTVLLEQKASASQRLAEAEAANEAERNAAPVADADADAASRAAAAAGIRIQMGQDRTQLDPKRGFASHADQLSSIIKAGHTGVVDPRLKPMAAAGADEQGGHTDPHGGFLLAPAFAPDILSVEGDVDPVAPLVRRVPMERSTVSFNARVDKNHASSVSGGLTVSRTPETKAATSSRMEFEQVELVAHDLCGAAYATNRILRESPTSFIALLVSGFRDEFAAKLLDERLNGTGSGEFDGVISADATISVAKETGQAADTIVFENVNKMRARCWRYGRAIWLANNDTLPQVTTLYQPIGTAGERVSIYAAGDEDAPEGRLLGRPIHFTEFAKTLGDKGDIVLGVWSEYLEGDYGPMDQASSVHVRFLEREQTFLFTVANDAKPWWRSALTPKYSTTTLSPFVVLAARA